MPSDFVRRMREYNFRLTTAAVVAHVTRKRTGWPLVSGLMYLGGGQSEGRIDVDIAERLILDLVTDQVAAEECNENGHVRKEGLDIEIMSRSDCEEFCLYISCANRKISFGVM